MYTHIAGPRKGGLFVDYDQSMPKMSIAERELRAKKHHKPKKKAHKTYRGLRVAKGFDMELMYELINSGITLKGKNKQMVEDYIFAISEYTYLDGYTGKRFK